MSTSTKLQAPAVEIAKQIENGTYSIVERVYNKQFFNEIHPNVFAIKQESRLQIRDADVDQDFIESAVNKNTPHHIKKKTIIFFRQSDRQYCQRDRRKSSMAKIWFIDAKKNIKDKKK